MDENRKAILKLISTSESKVDTLPISNGQLIFVRDKKKILLDYGNIRTAYEEISVLNNDAERINLEIITDGFYFVLETSTLWHYHANKWNQLTSTPSSLLFQADTYLSFPSIGTSESLYIATEENAIYRWDDTKLMYYCIGRDYNDIKIIDCNF